ncbi:MAG: hypothetical protein FWF60_09830 [Oscillospiraceae bacterium]|nr:hypothetical protein [Oscillospiraceae bacterium]
MEIIFGVTGAILGLLGLVFSALAYHHNKIEAVNAFYENERNPHFINARRAVHDMSRAGYKPEEVLFLKAEDGTPLANYVSYVVLSYNQAGTLVEKRQLPIWLFETASGVGAVQHFEALKPYIIYRRENDTTDFGLPYENLVKAIKKKYPKEYKSY